MLRHYLPIIAAVIALLFAVLLPPLSDQLAGNFSSLSFKTSSVSAQPAITPGDGLKGTYFSNPNCTGTSKTQIDATINFPPDPFSIPSGWGNEFFDPCIKWKGQIFIEGGAGDYTFFLTHDDAVTLFVNGTQVYTDTQWRNAPQASTPISLKSRQRYDIELNFDDRGGHEEYVILGYRGPGVSDDVIPQRVLYSSKTVCSDSIDNDNDGKVDFPNDPGCLSAFGTAESGCGNNIREADNNEVCDGTDLGGKTCVTETGPGHLGTLGCAADCKSFNTSQCSAPPSCSDGLDNDGDRKIDFPADPGCSSAAGTDETDAPPPPPPPIDRNIILKRGTQPTLIIQPLLKAQEVIKFTTTCANCTIQAVPDPATFKAGTAEADRGFTILATLVNNADQSLTHTILVVGNAEENAKLSTADGQEYISQGNEINTQYPASFLSGSQNEYYIKARVDNLFEQVEVTPTPLPTTNGAAIKNGSAVFLFFEGNDSIGKKHVLITKGRFWDANTLADPALTPEPFHTFFQNKGSLAQCVQGLQAYPNIGTLFENPTGFQLFLDLLTLCQR